jgi:predicted metal-binding protein
MHCATCPAQETEVVNCTKEKLHFLLQEAKDHGATDAILLPVKEIEITDSLAHRCSQPKCINYGLSKSCPPHVAGPGYLREKLKDLSWAVFFRIEVPSEILYSSQSDELFRLLHETAASLELSAKKHGFASAQGFAGNSCKKVFCQDYLECRVVNQDGICRNPDRARPSMSGFGVDVTKLYHAAGWSLKGRMHDNGNRTITLSSISGLVLIC